MTVYWEECQAYGAADIERAMRVAWRVHPRWFPTLGELVQLIENPEAADGATRLSALDAWPEVLALASGSRSALSDDVAAKAVALMGGRKTLGRMDAAELAKWGRREFMETYLAVARREERAEALEAARTPPRLQPRAAREIGRIADASRLDA